MIDRFLFSAKLDTKSASLFLLALRILFGVLLMTHGIQKLMGFGDMSAMFPDPLGVGNALSLGLVIFAELACSIAFIFGFLFRLAVIPMIVTMAIAFFVIHGSDLFAQKELAFVYLTVYILMCAVGPGEYSVDKLISNKLRSKREDVR